MQSKDRVKFATATTGTGPVTVGAAETGFRTPAQAEMGDGQSATYAIEDGSAWETGLTVYTVAGTVLSRDMKASSTGALLVLTGSAKMYLTPTGFMMDAIDMRGAATLIATGFVSN